MSQINNQLTMDYLYVLDALSEIPFPVGKTLLSDFLIGRVHNKSIMKNKMYNFLNFGALKHRVNIDEMIDSLISQGFIQVKGTEDNKFHKVLFLTKRGEIEIENPSLYNKQQSFDIADQPTVITDLERELFASFGSFLHGFNEQQKKAIVYDGDKILCIAGAGSGKTTVLVKRIEFLVKYNSIPQDKILAITFTRKARQEMQSRLHHLGLQNVRAETFNSFCEKFLQSSSDYIKSKRVMAYGDKIQAIKMALESLNLNWEQAINTYFSQSQKVNKSTEELSNTFMNDCFSVLDYYKTRKESLKDFSDQVDEEHKKTAIMVYKIALFLKEFMDKHSLRDYTDQLVDTLKIFQASEDSIPKFDYLFVDEYQDVNSLQVELIDLLNTKNLFCVGDPRQSIFGWRGSDINHILKFKDKYPPAKIISLIKNYRSNKSIVNLINQSIKSLSLPDLQASNDEETKIDFHNFESEEDELLFVLEKIITNPERGEIFVIARTNRQLKDLSNLLKTQGIKHITRTDELKTTVIKDPDDVTLSTVHAIKGLEAKTVFVIGCTANNFPCKASDHPVIEIMKLDQYNKEEEERRLLYVALSRAKDKLYISYSGKKLSPFITEDMRKLLRSSDLDIFSKTVEDKPTSLIEGLKKWRKETAIKEEVPAFVIFSDKTLIELVDKKPQHRHELESIYGLGYTKIMKYGDEILNVVSDFN